MALARLAAEYAEAAGAEILALTVDHGLRAGSATEAEKAARWCRDMGLAHQTLHWGGDKPDTGVQDAARQARYRLLAAACESAGIDALLTAHTSDDQAETVFMRLARGAGVRGLGAMADETLIAAGPGAPVRLLRPMLSFSRSRVTATVEKYDQPFVDDPSNDDPAFERIRTRALLAALEEQGLLTRDALVKTSDRARAVCRALDKSEVERFEELGGQFHGWGAASLDENKMRQAESDPALGALAARLIQAAAGAGYRPPWKSADDALAGALRTGASALGGVLIKRAGNSLFFMREPAAVLGRAGVAALAPAMLQPGEKMLYDRRFIIVNSTAGALGVAPLGKVGAAALMARTGFSGPAEAAQTLPGLERDGALIGAGGYSGGELTNVSAAATAQRQFFDGIIRF